MTAPRMTGLSVVQDAPSSLLTVMKSAPKKTPVTPSSANSRVAKGERVAASASAKFAVPCSITVRPGRNLRVAGLGVVSVSMNIVALQRVAHELGHGRSEVNPSENGVKAQQPWAGNLRPAPRSVMRLVH